MRVLITGSYHWLDSGPIAQVIEALPKHVVVIHGGANCGVDLIAENVASGLGLRIERYPINHELDGPWPQAGPRRNSRMIREGKPEFCFAFRVNGESNGTDDCVRKCRSAGVHTYVIEQEGEVKNINEYIAYEQMTLEKH